MSGDAERPFKIAESVMRISRRAAAPDLTLLLLAGTNAFAYS